jgi:RNA polymerase sigma-70 factor (ECF subfamily)
MNEGGASDQDTWRDVSEIAEEYGVAMYRVAVAVVQDPALAEDVVQDSLLRVWDGLDGFRGDAPLRAWVLRITHNTAVSALRRIRDETWDPRNFPERPRDARIEETVIARAELDTLRTALGELDELTRSILALREVEGMSYDDIAATLELTTGQVKIRLFRARRRLRELVTGETEPANA